MKSRRLRLALATVFVALLARSAAAAGVVITWDPTDEPEVAGYLVRYGTQSNDYQARVDVGLATTFKVDGLAPGRTYYFTVQAYAADGTMSAPATELPAIVAAAPATALPTATFTMPLDAEGRLTTPVLTWTPVPGAQGYALRVGSTPGAGDLVDVPALQATSYTLPDLPADQTFVARLFTRQADRWSASEIAFKAPQLAAAARFVAPLNGQLAVTSAQIFQWTPVPKAQAYSFTLGTQPGAADVAASGDTLRTTWTVPALPSNRRLYARLSTKLNDHWYAAEIEVVSAPTAVLLYPVDQTADVSAAETFTWSALTDAQAYRLLVGTAPDGADLFDSGETKATSAALSGLRPGQTLYVRLDTRLQDGWVSRAVTVTTAIAARFTRPVAGDGADLGAGLAWTTILGADAYALRLGTAPGLGDLLDAADLRATAFETPALPAGQPIYAQIATHLDGVWTTRETTLTLAGAALQPPAPASALGQLLTWTTIANADAYALWIGTEPGAKDLLDTGALTTTSALVKTLPAGRPAYATLWTQVHGVWTGGTPTLLAR